MCFSSFAERDGEQKCEHDTADPEPKAFLEVLERICGIEKTRPDKLAKSGPMIALMPNVMKFIAPVALPFIAPPNPRALCSR